MRNKITLSDLDFAGIIHEGDCYSKTISYEVAIIQSKHMLPHSNNMVTSDEDSETTWTNIIHPRLRSINILLPEAIFINNIVTMIHIN